MQTVSAVPLQVAALAAVGKKVEPNALTPMTAELANKLLTLERIAIARLLFLKFERNDRASALNIVAAPGGNPCGDKTKDNDRCQYI